jgi:probable FeS assembly SUF system protein SufT
VPAVVLDHEMIGAGLRLPGSCGTENDMNPFENLHPQDRVTFSRDCEVTQIPSGTTMTIGRGVEGIVTQTLGGYVTLHITQQGMLVQVAGHNVDALLKDGQPVAPAAATTTGAAPPAAGPANEKDVWDALKTCYDPEIPLNIVDLGLVYDVKLTPLPSTRSRVDVKMTLTAVGCGMGPVIAMQARDKLLQLPGVEEADVQIVWDPPWNQSMISEEGKKRLGLW